MMDKWQPIETAPHDTKVLLYCPHRGIANEERIELGKATFGEYIPGVKSTRGAHAWATHWMPLPEFPIPEE